MFFRVVNFFKVDNSGNMTAKWQVSYNSSDIEQVFSICPKKSKKWTSVLSLRRRIKAYFYGIVN